ncbi:MAG: hypothetical protein EOO77_04425 [Oxalobacteraceae bacterium]|nr:MAG: hypothetical protein EOO77_04425 [Oxalobacteraceae bacterium]
MSYMRNAIAPTTRKTYDSAVATFRQWRRDNGVKEIDALPSADEVLTWAAELADRGQHAAASIRGYVSAIGEWYATNAHPDSNAQNPTQSGSVRRLLDGIERDKHSRARELTSGDAAAQPLLYTTLQKFQFSDTPRDRMRRAAAFLGVAGAFRPGELFPSASGRPLLRGQLQFFQDAAGTQLMTPTDIGGSPRVLEVTLQATKTSQLKEVQKFVTASDAVLSCWQWYCDTASRGPDAIFLQEQPGGQPLTAFALCKHLERLHQRAGLGMVRYQGKSLRQGGASTLAVQGVAAADIAALGWAPGSAMWEHYARDPQVRRQRAISLGKLMQPVEARQPGRERVVATASAAAAAGRR